MFSQQPGLAVKAALVFSVSVMCAGSNAAGQPSAPGQAGAGPAEVQIADPATFPEVVARVNGTAIAKAELIDRVEAVKQRMHLPPGQTPMQVYRIVLGELVDFELLYQASTQRQTAATAEEVDAEFQKLRAQFPSDEAFQQQLAAESVTAERLKSMLLKDLSVQKLVETQLASSVVITDEQKRRFYEENTESMQEPEQLRLRHILARVPDGADEGQKARLREKLEGLRQQVERGADFAKLARENSDDTGSREEGGEMTVRRGQTVEPFETAAFALQPGGLSPVVETRYGYHIIQLLERTPARQVPYEEVEPRIQRFLEQQAVQQKVREEIESLKRTATIEVLL
ncbi:MAG: peptidylprolyl isomerase [Acidobacteriota bacterium]